MLYFIGLGLDKEGISLEGLKVAKKCDELYLEDYTSIIPNLSLEELKEKFNNEIKVLRREDLEEDPDVLLKEAKTKDIGLLVMGDPLVATTHISLKLEAEERGIKTKVIHASSIYSAVAELGLQIYKFGKSATIPMDYETDVPYETIKENRKRGLHTLLFLDLDPKQDDFLRISEAIDYLLEKESERGEDVFKEDTKVVGVARIGASPTVFYGKAKKVKKQDFGRPPYVLIVVGKLHFMEEEALETYKI